MFRTVNPLMILTLFSCAHAAEKPDEPQSLKIGGQPEIVLEVKPDDTVFIKGEKVGKAPGAYANIAGSFSRLDQQLKGCQAELEKTKPPVAAAPAKKGAK